MTLNTCKTCAVELAEELPPEQSRFVLLALAAARFIKNDWGPCVRCGAVTELIARYDDEDPGRSQGGPS